MILPIETGYDLKMSRLGVLLLASFACPLYAQRVDAPCIPPFRADRAHIRNAEATGGHVFLLDKSEIAHPDIAVFYARSSDPTLLRVSGALTSGAPEFSAPVDSTVESLQFIVFAECVRFVEIRSPSGVELKGTALRSGKLAHIARPEPGEWKVKLAGTGYFSVVAQGRTSIRFETSPLVLPFAAGGDLPIVASVTGAEGALEFRALARNGAALATIPMATEEGSYKGVFTMPREPFRIAVEGRTPDGAPWRRVKPQLIEPE